jgi:hypothetical protein
MPSALLPNIEQSKKLASSSHLFSATFFLRFTARENLQIAVPLLA